MPPAAELSDVYISSVFSHNSLAVFVKYYISALGCSPKTPGEVNRGISSMQFMYYS